jgi:membrane fusion protein, multidrug efflux system
VNIEDLDAMYVDFRLPERYQTKISPGQTAQVEVDALPARRFSASVLAVDPLLDANGRSIGVRGCIDNRRLELRPGMFARVTPVFGVREDARVIPEEAIVPQGGRQFVYKLVDGPDQDTRIAQRVEVKVGIRQPGKVEITEGLMPGDLVVTAGQQRIQKDGMAVRVLDLGKAGAANGATVAGGPPAAARRSAETVEAPQPGNPCGAFAAAPRMAPAQRVAPPASPAPGRRVPAAG